MLLRREIARPVGLAVLLAAGALAANADVTQDAKPAQEAKKDGTTFTSVWKMDLPAGTKRVAVADVTGDSKPRLLVLSADGKLTVHKLAATATAPGDSEGSISLGENAAKFVVGRFNKGKPAMIAVPGAIYYRQGDTYAKKAADLADVSGSVRFTDGSEYIVRFDGQGPPHSHGVDITAGNPLIDGPEMPEPKAEGGTYSEVVIALTPELMDHLPLPEEAKKGGIIRLIDPHGNTKLFALLAWQAAEGPYAVLVDGGAIFTNGGADIKPLWKSPKLAGKILDIAPAADLKGGKKSGFLVLHEAGTDGKGRVLEFFALD